MLRRDTRRCAESGAAKFRWPVIAGLAAGAGSAAVASTLLRVALFREQSRPISYPVGRRAERGRCARDDHCGGRTLRLDLDRILQYV